MSIETTKRRSFSEFGNDLYTGKRSIDFVGRLRRWMIISLVVTAIIVAGFFARGGLKLGIEFTGGSDFRVAQVANTDGYADRAGRVVSQVGGQQTSNVTLVGGNSVRVETARFDDTRTQDVANALAKEFGVPSQNVSASVIGPSWGASVSRQALQALLWFLVLVSIVLALYFRTWKMALAALVALAHDIFLTVGIYALAGFEVTPASMIGFLTILGYSLYDTVVVFDKVRENTTESMRSGDRTYSEAANLAVNQTLVRSINTSVVALLPVAAVLVMGFTVLGPGTLLDLSLALFVGIAVGTYSSIFIATPILAWLREKEPAMRELRERVQRRREGSTATFGPSGEVPDERGERTIIGDDTPAAPRRIDSDASTHLDHLADDDLEDDAADAADTGRGASPTRTATGRPMHPSMQQQRNVGPAPRRRPPRSKR